MLSMRGALNNLLGLITMPTELIVRKPVAAAENYVADDVISEHVSAGTAWIFNLKSKSGVIEKSIITCRVTALTPRLTLKIFSEPPGCVLNDNVANTAVILGDEPVYQGSIDHPAMEDLGTGQSETIATPNTVGNLPLVYYSESKKLYCVLITRDAITAEIANMAVMVKLQVRQD